MKRILVFVLLISVGLGAMEPKELPRDVKQGNEKRVVAAMLDAAKPSYERAFRIVDALDAKQCENYETINLLKKLATQQEYRQLLKYAFDEKKILSTDELASSLLLEAARKQYISYTREDVPPLEDLLGYGVDPNKPGKLLENENRDEQRYTPLALAVKKGRHWNVRILLEKGVDANICQPHENLPLIEAWIQYHKWISDRRPTSKNPTGFRYFFYQDIQCRLRQYGADEHRDNGKDVEIEDSNRVMICRTAFDIKCRLGYNGI